MEIANKAVDIVQKNKVGHNQNSLSNGALMRISPLALMYYDSPELTKFAAEDASITHVKKDVMMANEIYITALAMLLKGHSNFVFFLNNNINQNF